jgi:preprotein translocase subunit SecD
MDMGTININWNSPLPFIDANLSWFQQRIQMGVNDGSLVQSEQQTLQSELSQIQQLEQQDEKNGITQQEVQQLWNELAQMNADIYNLRHNPLGVDLPSSQTGEPPELITAQNFWEHPAVAHTLDEAPPSLLPSQVGDSSFIGSNPFFNPVFPGAPTFASNPFGLDQQAFQFETQQIQQLEQSMNLAKQYAPNFWLGLLPGLIGLGALFL